MTQNQIIPALWYHTPDGHIAEVIDYYAEIFENQMTAEQPTPLGDTPSGYAEMCQVTLLGNKYTWMTTALEHHPFNDSFALTLLCENQTEIDKYWNYFTAEGQESMCGWCNDRYGLRWQIIPQNLAELMARPNAQQVMYKQKKIIIAEYL